jgi:hypothetical protein
MTRKLKSQNEECCLQCVTVCARVGLDVYVLHRVTVSYVPVR